VRVISFVVALLLFSGCVASGAPKAQTDDACSASPIISVGDAQRPLVVRWGGGAIAGPSDVDHRVGSKGQFWIIAGDAPPRTTLITAQRLGSTTQTVFELWRYYAKEGSTDPVVVHLPNGSSGALYAATATGAVLYEAGCWRVEIANADAVTIPVR